MGSCAYIYVFLHGDRTVEFDPDYSEKMGKLSLHLLAVCALCALDQALGMGYGYYLSNYPDTAALYNFSPYAEIMKPDCDKKKEKESKESSSSSSSSEDSKESGSKEESKSSGEDKSGEESGSKEEKKESGEESKGESEESKEAPKKAKKSKYVFPPRTYAFPARQQIVYSPGSAYSYLPYRSSYVYQQPASYYQYLTLPSASTIGSTYAVSNPVAKIVYSSPAVNYPTVSKTVLTPGARVYSAPAAWNSPVSYYTI